MHEIHEKEKRFKNKRKTRQRGGTNRQTNDNI